MVGTWDTNDLGQLKWDAQFTVSLPQNQLSLLNLCDWLENESELVQNGIVDCWIRNLDEFIRNDSEDAEKLPLDDRDLFDKYLTRFIKEDPYGINAYRTQKLGFLEVNNNDGLKVPVFQFMEISA